jgi:hypothetical protein
MPLPTFIIGGAPKTGTTSLYRYLLEHPQVFLPRDAKEPHYFVESSAMPLAEYEALFVDVGGARAVGEASTWYLRDRVAPARVRALIPDARLIFVLRHPVERARSHYWHRVAQDSRFGARPFGEWIRAGERDVACFVDHGLYADHLQRWLGHFPREQILAVLHEDLERDAPAVLRRICTHIGVDAAFEARTDRRHNVTAYPRSMGLYRGLLRFYLPMERALEGTALWRHTRRPRQFVRDLLYARGRPAPPVSPEDRAYLLALYRPQVAWLEEYLGRDLSAWKT